MFLFCYNILYFRVISLNVVIVVLQVVSLVLNSMTEDIPLFLSPPPACQMVMFNFLPFMTSAVLVYSRLLLELSHKLGEGS